MIIPNMGCILPFMGIHRRALETHIGGSGLADALFSKVQQRVLGILFGSPDKSFYANQIIALANSGHGAVQRELARLLSVGITTSHSIGNQKHYQANAQSPIFEPLRNLVLKTFGLGDVLRSSLAPLSPRITFAFVYGSVAKGNDRASSDIDLMIVSDTLVYADLFSTLDAVSGQLNRTVNPVILSPGELSKRIRQNKSFTKRVLSQPKIWLIGGEDDIPTR